MCHESRKLLPLIKRCGISVTRLPKKVVKQIQERDKRLDLERMERKRKALEIADSPDVVIAALFSHSSGYIMTDIELMNCYFFYLPYNISTHFVNR